MENKSSILLQPEEVKKIENFRRLKKTAVLTILFTDIVGFTEFTEDAGEGISSKYRQLHDQLFFEVVTRDNAGEIVKQIGDSFLAIFAEPSTAVLKALEFQKRIDENKDKLTYKNYTLKVRIGIHLGQVSIEDTFQPDVFGRHVNRASRIESIAKGGQILTSQSVWENAAGWVKDEGGIEIDSCSCGKAKLKGISKPVDIYEFYYGDVGTLGIPDKIREQRTKKRITAFAYSGLILLLVILAGYFTGTWERLSTKPEPILSKDLPDSLYLWDIISSIEDLKYFTEDFGINIKTIPDSQLSVINEQLLSILISTYYPDVVIITYKDIMEKFAILGKLPPKPNSGFDYMSGFNFLSEVGCNRGVYIWIYSDQEKYYYYLEYYTPEVGTLNQIYGESEFENLISDFNEIFVEIKNRELKDSIKGEILSCMGEDLVISLEKKSNLRTGTMLWIRRPYGICFKPDDEGFKQRLNELEEIKDYFSDLDEWKKAITDDCDWWWSYEAYQSYKSGRHFAAFGEGSDRALGISAKITEIFDSTATAVVVEKRYPCINIKKGDKWYLK